MNRQPVEARASELHRLQKSTHGAFPMVCCEVMHPRPLALIALLLLSCREAAPPPRVGVLPDCRTQGRAEDPATYSCKVTEVLASQKLGSTIDALLKGQKLPAGRSRPEATVVTPLQGKAVIKLLAASVPPGQRADVEMALEAERNANNEEAKIVLMNAGVRTEASLAAAATHLIATALRFGPNTTLSDEQLASLLIVIDAALAPTAAAMKPEDQEAALDALLIEAGLMGTANRVDPRAGRAMATSCLARFKLR